jgi:hypothetical protein
MLGRLIDRIPHHTIPIDGKPYLTRYFLTGKNEKVIGERPNLFLHHFHMSDQGRELHNHPYTGTSLILKSGYIEERVKVLGLATHLDYSQHGVTTVMSTPAYSQLEAKVVRAGDINRLGLDDFHRAELLDTVKGAWTLFYTGPRVKEWGFLNRRTLEFFPYESRHASRLGRGPHAGASFETRAQEEALKALEEEVTLVLDSHLTHETPGRIAHALRLRQEETP